MEQPRCPSADEWIRKLWYIHTMEYYSAIKKNTFKSHFNGDFIGKEILSRFQLTYKWALGKQPVS